MRLLNEEKKKNVNLSLAEELNLIEEEVYQIRDFLDDAKNYARKDILAKEKERLAILSSYLTNYLNDADIQKLLIAVGVGPNTNEIAGDKAVGKLLFIDYR